MRTVAIARRSCAKRSSGKTSLAGRYVSTLFVWNAVLTLSLGPWHDGAWPLARTGWKERIQLEALHAQ